MNTAVQAAFSIGDYQFNNQHFHGTPNQRAAAVITGANAAFAVANRQLPLSYPALRNYFYNEIIRIMSTVR